MMADVTTVRREPPSDYFLEFVLDHWQNNHPDRAAQLAAAGRLRSEASLVAEKCLGRVRDSVLAGAAFEDVLDVIEPWWKQPPEL